MNITHTLALGGLTQAQPLPAKSDEGYGSLWFVIVFAIALLASVVIAWLRSKSIARLRVLGAKDAIALSVAQAESAAGHEDVAQEIYDSAIRLKDRFLPFSELNSNSKTPWWVNLSLELNRIDGEARSIIQEAARQIAHARTARHMAPRLLTELPTRVNAAKERLAQARFSRSAHSQLENAENLLRRARSWHSNDPVRAYPLLHNASESLRIAETAHPVTDHHSSHNSTSGDVHDVSSDFGFGDSSDPGGDGGCGGCD